MNKSQKENEEIQAIRDDLRWQRVELLNTIGRPECDGDYSERQKKLWAKVYALEQKEQEFLKTTVVINLDSLGHDIGRVYRRKVR